MAILDHAVEQMITATSYSRFEGLERLSFRVVLPDWHEPFPSQVRVSATDPRELKCHGLYAVSRAWYINGPVMDQFTISMGLGPINVPTGTRIISEELPEQWEANAREASAGKQEWWAYSNGRNKFC